MLEGIRTRLRNILRRDRVELEMEAELQSHLDNVVELNIRRGLSPEDAILAARRELGSFGVLAEDARAARGAAWLDDLRRDVRHALRALARTPGFTAVVVVTLALGFGVNSALFSIMRGAMRSSPIVNPESWVQVADLWSYADFAYLRDSVRSLRLTATSEQPVLVGRDGENEPEEATALFVAGGYFEGLGGRPASGRLFGDDELSPPAGEPVAVLAHRYWARRFAMDSGIVGKTIRLAGGQAFTVIGVMPRGFAGQSLRSPDLWLPVGARQRLPGIGNQLGRSGDDTWFGAGGREFLFLAGRLAPGASFEAARAELQLRIGQLPNPGEPTRAEDIARYLRTADRPGINSAGEVAAAGLLLAAAISVLLIASATVANLMLARATARRREMGVRLALGASRFRVVRSWLTECLLLGGVAAVFGLLLSWWTVRAFILNDRFTEIAKGMDLELFLKQVAPDLAVVGYLAVLAVFSTLVSGLVPGIRATRGDALAIMRDGGSGTPLARVRLRSGLVVVQLALTMVLLLASGMLVRGLMHATRIDPGFDRHDVMVLRPRLTLSGYDSVRAKAFIDELHQRAATVPGVRSVTRGNVPIWNAALATISRVGSGDTLTGGQFNAVTETYFTTLGIEIVRGRTFTGEEVRREAPVTIISENTARLLFAGEEAIGQVVSIRPRVRGLSELSRSGERPAPGLFESARVVGIAADAQMGRLGVVSRRYAYVPGDYWDLLVRRDPSSAAAVTAGIRLLGQQIDPDVILDITALEEAIWQSSGYLELSRMTSGIAAGVGMLSLLMAVVGLFGLTAYTVEQRTREFGVRMALGARAGDVVRLVAGQSLRLVAIGGVVGIAGAAAGGGVLRAMLFGVSAVDPIAYGAVVLLLAAVSFIACYVPARRATRVDPMIALRVD